MKIWRFYKKPDGKDDTDQQYDLYALTNDPKIAKRFMSERDMNKFITKVTKEDNETYVKLANDNLSLVLSPYKFATKKLNGSGLYTIERIEILATDYEHESCDSEYVSASFDQFINECPDYRIFKRKIVDALRTLEYVSQYKIYNMHATIDCLDDDFSAPDLAIDEVGAFINIYGDLFK